MRTTIVPAQITTVEDRIAGNLTLTQIFLLLTPVFLGSIIYLLFPPKLHFALYKLPIILVLALVCGILAFRFKGRILLQWIAILFRYNTRPRYFIANKNDSYEREIFFSVADKKEEKQKAPVAQKTKEKQMSHITIQDMVRLESLVSHPKANVRFIFARKGGLDVSLSEIKE